MSAENGYRTPPHDLGAESACIGACLVHEGALEVVVGKLDAVDFFSERHRAVFTAIERLHAQHLPVDQRMLADELGRVSADDPDAAKKLVFRLVESVPTASNAGRYADIVREKALLRRVIDVSERAKENAFNGAAAATELIDAAETQLYEIGSRADRGQELVEVGEFTSEVLERLHDRATGEGGITGVPTGYRDLDKMTGGLQEDDLVILAARPSMGKTAEALGWVMGAAEAGHDVAYFSLEMERDDLVERLLSRKARMDLANLRHGLVEEHHWPVVMQKMAEISELPIHVNDDMGLDVQAIRGRCRRLQRRLARHGRQLKVVFVDYLQLMLATGNAENRQVAVAEISRSLKMLARELGVCVVVLAQLSRGVEHRADKRPLMSDLRESGAIENDADLIIMIYREEYYEGEDTEEDHKGVAELLIRKHRNGPTGTVKQAFVETYASFEDLAPPREDRPGAIG